MPYEENGQKTGTDDSQERHGTGPSMCHPVHLYSEYGGRQNHPKAGQPPGRQPAHLHRWAHTEKYHRALCHQVLSRVKWHMPRGKESDTDP